MVNKEGCRAHCSPLRGSLVSPCKSAFLKVLLERIAISDRDCFVASLLAMTGKWDLGDVSRGGSPQFKKEIRGIVSQESTNPEKMLKIET